MLVLSRKSTESVVIDHDIRITVLKIRRHCVSLGIDTPQGKRVYRNEILCVRRPICDGTPPETDHPRDDQAPTP